MKTLDRTRLTTLLAGLLAALTLACDAQQPPPEAASVEPPVAPSRNSTLGRALERGTLRVLILPRSEQYLPRAGESTLRERNIVKEFAADLGLSVQFVDVSALGELIPALLEDRGDLIASNFTNTRERSQRVVFSSPLEVVREQVVTRSDDDRLSSRRDLAGRRLAVLRGSAHFQTALELAQRVPGLEIETVEAGKVTEDLLLGVEAGKYDLALVDSNLMRAAQNWHPDLRVAFDAGEPRMIAWGMRRGDDKLRRAADSFLARTQLGEADEGAASDDFAGILERGRLRVLTRNTATTYFVWRGELVGFEYELVRRFAKQHKLQIDMVVPPRSADLVPWLLAGKGDMIAAGFTISDRRPQIRFSSKYLDVEKLVVTRSDDVELQGEADLVGRTFVVRRGSGHWRALERAQQAGLPIQMEAAPDGYETEEIIAAVASGEFDLTLADSHMVDVELALRDDIRAAFAIGDSRELGWAVRADSPELLAKLDEFWANEYKGLFYNVTARKYFGSDRAMRQVASVPAHRTGQISPFDELVRKYATRYGFDWRLVVAQMHQESRFDPEAESFAGAQGLLQVMPGTAEQMGLVDLHDPEIGIQAGVRYLNWVRDRFEPSLPAAQRTWFALAAYNAGAGHVNDARKIARQMGLDPNRWFDNVELAMLRKDKEEVHVKTRFGYCNGQEPVRYVRAISDRYDAYVRIAGTSPPPTPTTLRVANASLP